MNTADLYLNKTQQRSMGGNDREFIEDLTPQRPAGRANHKTSLQLSAVWSCLNGISGDVAKLPFNMVDVSESETEIATAHPTHRAIRYKPNNRLSAFRFWRTFMFHALLWNKAYAYIERNIVGQCVGLWNLPPENVHAVQNPDEFGDMFLIYLENGSIQKVPSFAILDVVGVQHDMSDMLDTTELASLNWGTGLATNDFINKFFTQGAMASGLLEIPAETKAESAVNLANGLDEALKGLSNAFATIPLRDGAKYHQLTVRPVDAQVAELVAMNVKDVGRWFNYPPSKLGADDSGGYGSREQDARNYLDSCLSVWLANISAQCWFRLLTTDAQNRLRYEFQHDTTQLLATDMMTQHQVLEIGIRTGLYNPNEARRTLGLNPRPGGDQYYHSNNMQPDGQDEPPAAPAAPADGQGDEQVPDEVMAEAERMWKLDVERIAQQMRVAVRWQRSRRGDGFADWWDGNGVSDSSGAPGTAMKYRWAEQYQDQLTERAQMWGALTDQDPHNLAAQVVTEIFDEVRAGDL